MCPYCGALLSKPLDDTEAKHNSSCARLVVRRRDESSLEWSGQGAGTTGSVVKRGWSVSDSSSQSVTVYTLSGAILHKSLRLDRASTSLDRFLCRHRKIFLPPSNSILFKLILSFWSCIRRKWFYSCNPFLLYCTY